MEVINIGLRLFEGTGEGPHYDSETDEIFLVDIRKSTVKESRGRLLRRKLGDSSAKFEVHDMGENYTSFIIPTTSGKFLVGYNQAVAEVDWPKDGSPASHTIMTTVDEGKPTRFNDGKCDPRGRLLAGTMSLEKAAAVVVAEEVGSLYGVNTDRSLRVIDDKYTLSNGLEWTADGKSMFFVDSIMRKVFAYEYDLDNFSAKNRRVLFDLAQHSDLEGVYPDGCCIDSEDRLWLAGFNGSNVMCLDTKTGERLREIKIPTTCVTSCCFAGPNLDQLVVTTSKTGAKDSDTEAGSLYLVKNLGAKGVPMVKFAG